MRGSTGRTLLFKSPFCNKISMASLGQFSEQQSHRVTPNANANAPIRKSIITQRDQSERSYSREEYVNN